MVEREGRGGRERLLDRLDAFKSMPFGSGRGRGGKKKKGKRGAHACRICPELVGKGEESPVFFTFRFCAGEGKMREEERRGE